MNPAIPIRAFAYSIVYFLFVFPPAVHPGPLTWLTSNPKPWTVAGDKDLWREYRIPDSEQTRFFHKGYYYSPETRQFYIHSIMQKAEDPIRNLSVPDNRNVTELFFRIDPHTGDSGWVAEMVLTDRLYKLRDYSKEVFISSSLMRNNGKVFEMSSDRAQPFGQYRLTRRLSEEPYSRERPSTGMVPVPHIPGGPTYTEHLGRGFVSLEIRDEVQLAWFTLEDEYEDNSKEYSAWWSPDGRYVFIKLPGELPESGPVGIIRENRFIVAGPFAVSTAADEILAALKAKKVALNRKRDRNEFKRRYRKGEITADQYYGPVYTIARQKILGCSEVLNETGSIKSLKFKDVVLNFGNPEIVGKSFTFSYEAERGKGSFFVTELHPGHMKKWGEKYRDYLETIDIRTGSETVFAHCPKKFFKHSRKSRNQPSLPDH